MPACVLLFVVGWKPARPGEESGTPSRPPDTRQWVCTHTLYGYSRMTAPEKLLEPAKHTPANLTFSDFCTLADQRGWTRRRTKGSHPLCAHPNAGKMQERDPRPLTRQKMKAGKAKPEQGKEGRKRARDRGMIDEGVAPGRDPHCRRMRTGPHAARNRRGFRPNAQQSPALWLTERPRQRLWRRSQWRGAAGLKFWQKMACPFLNRNPVREVGRIPIRLHPDDRPDAPGRGRKRPPAVP